MSIQAMSRVMEASEAKAMDRLVLLVMANRAGGDHDECFASVERLAHECRVDTRTVQRAQRRLVTSGDLVLMGIHPEYRTNIHRVLPVETGVAESHPRGASTPPAPPKRKKPGSRLVVSSTSLDSDLVEKPATPSRSTLADAILAPDSRAMYLRTRLIERDPARWIALSPAALMKLGKEFGAASLIEGLSYVYEQDDTAFDAYPYLLTICRRIAERESA